MLSSAARESPPATTANVELSSFLSAHSSDKCTHSSEDCPTEEMSMDPCTGVAGAGWINHLGVAEDSISCPCPTCPAIYAYT